MEHFYSTIEDLLCNLLGVEIEELHYKSDKIGVESVASDRKCVKVKTKSGEEINIFMKIRRSGSVTEQIDSIFKIFQRESEMYGDILPTLETFLQGHADKSEELSVLNKFPKYFGSGLVGEDLYLVFEDILTGQRKYVTGKQEFSHSSQQIRFALSQLGQFHAISYSYQMHTKTSLVERYPILEEPVYHPDRVDNLRSMFQGSFIRHIKLLRLVLRGWYADNKIVKSNIGTVCQEQDLLTMLERGETLMEDIFSLLNQSNHKLLTHGDFHMWNIAFGGNGCELLTSATFFDLQSSRVSSGASDIVQYLYQVTTPDNRHQHLTEYVKQYCQAFRTQAEMILGGENSLEVCSEDWVMSEIKRLSLFGVMFGIDFILPRFLDNDQAFNSLTEGDLESQDYESVKKTIQIIDKSGANIWWALQTIFDIVNEFMQ